MLVDSRYSLYVNNKPTGCWADQLHNLRGEIVACLAAGDTVYVRDRLRDKVLSAADLKEILKF